MLPAARRSTAACPPSIRRFEPVEPRRVARPRARTSTPSKSGHGRQNTGTNARCTVYGPNTFSPRPQS
eukprot:3252968-Prymnesium_polylepis.1